MNGSNLPSDMSRAITRWITFELFFPLGMILAPGILSLTSKEGIGSYLGLATPDLILFSGLTLLNVASRFATWRYDDHSKHRAIGPLTGEVLMLFGFLVFMAYGFATLDERRQLEMGVPPTSNALTGLMFSLASIGISLAVVGRLLLASSSSSRENGLP